MLENEANNEGKAYLLAFFNQHPALILVMSDFVSMSYMAIDALEFEFELSQNLTCDVAFGSSEHNTYCLAKLGSLDRNALFNNNQDNRGEFSNQFERNYGQIIDWLYEIDRIKRLPSEVTPLFASENPNISVLLIIGRSEFLSQDEQDRLKWRVEKTWIDSVNIKCITYDALLEHFKFIIERRKKLSY